MAVGLVLIQGSMLTWLWAVGYVMLMVGLQMSVNTMMVTAGLIMMEVVEKATAEERRKQ
jgi:hypothetical protein